MKPGNLFLLFIFFSFVHFQAVAQCSNAVQTITYDTSVTGIGSTIDPYSFTFPKFDGSLGTLTEVRLASVVSLTYEYNIENTLSSARTHALRLQRLDEISGASLMLPISAEYAAPWKYHSLAASDGVTGSGSDFLSVPSYHLRNNDTLLNETIFNTADYIGSGTVVFDYSTMMLRTSNPASGAYITNDAASDDIRFSITYVYCSNVILSSNITSFVAQKKEESIHLSWFSRNEQPNTRFELLKSTDGKEFVSVASGSAITRLPSGKFTFRYIPHQRESGKLIFRIREREQNGVSRYSNLKVVDIGNDQHRQQIHLVPNPSRAGAATIIFDHQQRGDWQVELYTMSGQLIGRKNFDNALTGRVPSNTQLSPGMYVLRAVNTQTKESFTEKMTVY